MKQEFSFVKPCIKTNIPWYFKVKYHRERKKTSQTHKCFLAFNLSLLKGIRNDSLDFNSFRSSILSDFSILFNLRESLLISWHSSPCKIKTNICVLQECLSSRKIGWSNTYFSCCLWWSYQHLKRERNAVTSPKESSLITEPWNRWFALTSKWKDVWKGKTSWDYQNTKLSNCNLIQKN